MPDATNQTVTPPGIFVSHSHQDNDYCRAFVIALRSTGANVWYDESNMTEGDLLEKIQPEIYHRPVFVVILSDKARDSTWVNRESRWGYLSYEEDHKQRRFLPVTGAQLITDDFGPDWLFLRGFYRIEGPNHTPLSPQAAAQRVLAVINQIEHPLETEGERLTHVISSPPTEQYPGKAATIPGHSPSSLPPSQPAPSLPKRQDRESPYSSEKVTSRIAGRVIPPRYVSPSPIQPTIPSDTRRELSPVHRPPPLSKNPLPYSTTSRASRKATQAHRSPSKRWWLGSITLVLLLAGVVTVFSRVILQMNTPPGSLLWKYQTGAQVDSSPTVANGIVYIGSADDYVYALHANNGSLAWKYQTGDRVDSTPTVANGIVYIGSADDYVYALHANNGSLAWRFPIGGPVEGSPIIANGIVYIGSENDYVYALHATDGSLAWKFQTDDQVISSPTVANNIVYIGSQDDYVYALHASDGSLVWKYHTGDQVDSSPTVANGIVYIGSNDHYVYALHATDGSLAWKFLTGYIVDSSPTVADGIVYIGSEDTFVYALRANDGSLAWSFPTGTLVEGSPIIADGIVYIGSEDDYVYALHANNSSLAWKFKTGPVLGQPAIANNVVFVGSSDSNIYALRT